jgi:hypothetical protein
MSLFEFELYPIESIFPWGEEPNLSLSWFALTDGVLRINAGNHVLFRYSRDMIHNWEMKVNDADYQIAAFARDFIGCFKAAITPIPEFLQPLAWDWNKLRDLLIKSNDHDASYEAFRWLGERSPFTSYLTESPEISFIRKENEIIVGWDNRHCLIDGLPVWESQFGTFVISVDEFISECLSFTDRLLAEMKNRIMLLESGSVKAQIPLNSEDLFRQQDSWFEEFSEYFDRQYEPDVSWYETKTAIELIVKDFNTI